MKKIFSRFTLIAIISLEMFVFVPRVGAATDTIVITEIGAYEPAGQEWVEIYNNGTAAVDLAGWKFWENETNHGLTLAQGAGTIMAPGEFAVIAQNSETFLAAYSALSVLVFDSSWGSLKESGEFIGLRDAEGNSIEAFTYIAAPSFSLERANYGSGDYTGANWQEHVDGNTVGMENSIIVVEEEIAPSTSLSIRINEFVSNPESGEQEWIELFFDSAVSGDIAGWTIEDGVGTMATLDQTISGNGFIVLELSAHTLNNAGDTIILKNAVGEVIDQVVYGSWEDDTVSDSIPSPAKGLSMSYIDGAYVETPTTKGAQNESASSSSTTNDETENVQENLEIGTPFSTRSIEAGTIVINEFVSDPADGQKEFIELFNRSTEVVDITGWWVEDGGEAKTSLSGSIDPKNFFIVEQPKGNLNNAGDMIVLFEPNGIIIDRVVYGDWDDGKRYDNAPVASDPKSVVRREDGYDSDIDNNDFLVTSEITRGATNRFPQQEKEDQARAVRSPDVDVTFTELFPNPVGSDAQDEFIELRNNGLQSVDISGWQIGDSSSKRFTISDIVLAPGAYMSFRRSDTGVALNNTGGDTAILFTENNREADRVAYEQRVKEGMSFAKNDAGEWVWSLVASPGKENTIELPNEPPSAIIESHDKSVVGEHMFFDASDSGDIDGEIISFLWNFDDKHEAEGMFVEYTFEQSGTFGITLVVKDDRGATTEIAKEITVLPRYTQDGYEIGVRISEFMPNPEGSDTAEFIELHNPAAEPVDISGILLDDEDGGSRPFVIPKQTILQAGAFWLFEKRETGISLNNTRDSVRLLFPNKTRIQDVPYEHVVEGASLIEHSGAWVWTNQPTPGKENIFVEPVTKLPARGLLRKKAHPSFVKTVLAQIRDFDPGDRVTVTGTVAVLPGVFGSQYFYVTGASGIQVYSYKKDFPAFEVGDVVEISGELSETYGEMRLKVANKNDIHVVGSTTTLNAIVASIQHIGEEMEGNFLTIAGEITELKSSYMYVDDGTEEMRVYFKKGTAIRARDYHIGQVVSVAGLVSERNGVYQLLPRSPKDISIQAQGKALQQGIDDTQAGDAKVAETYLTATAGGLTSILIGLAARARGALALGIVRRAGSTIISSFRRWWG